jgi:hypothetical protein
MSLSRLLACGVCLTSLALSQNRPNTPVPPNSCPVTRGADHPYVPPAPYSAKAVSGGERWGHSGGPVWTLAFPSRTMISERSSPSRVRFAAQHRRALDRSGPF